MWCQLNSSSRLVIAGQLYGMWQVAPNLFVSPVHIVHSGEDGTNRRWFRVVLWSMATIELNFQVRNRDVYLCCLKQTR